MLFCPEVFSVSVQVHGVLLSPGFGVLHRHYPAHPIGPHSYEGSDTYLEGFRWSYAGEQEVQRQPVCDDCSGLG